MSDNYYKNKYIKYKTKYLRLSYGGLDKEYKSDNELTQKEIVEYQTGIIEMYHENLSKLDVLQVGVSKDVGSELITLSNLFKNYTVQESNQDKLDNAKQLCKKYSCKVSFVTTTKDLDKESFDVVLLYNSVSNIKHKKQLAKLLKDLLSLLDTNGVLVVDEPKNTSSIIKSFFTKDMVKNKNKMKNIKVKFFDKKTRNIYTVTKNEESPNVKSRLPVLPTERWY